MQNHEQDVFLWLEHPVIAEMRAVLDWAHKRALREDIRYRDIGDNGIDKYPSERKFEEIVGHFSHESKMFFRIIVRKGLNRFLVIDDKKHADLLDIVAHGVQVAGKEYFINCYLSSALLGQMKRRFALTEHIRY
jgi:hypothetical protein